MIRKLTARSSLDSLKKEAKRWLKAIRAGEPEAHARLQQVLPHAGAGSQLREIQQALAREHGFESWLLIERGADSFDTQALYNTSLWYDSTAWLDLLYGYDDRAGTTARWNEQRAGQRGQLDYLLGNAVDRNHTQRIKWLLAHGADAQTKHAYTGRQLHTTALLHGHAQIAELLANAGAEVEELQGYEAFQAACLRMDRDTARTLARQRPEYLSDAAALLMGASTGRVDVVELLLDLGTLPDAHSANGERALHVAAWVDSVLSRDCSSSVGLRSMPATAGTTRLR